MRRKIIALFAAALLLYSAVLAEGVVEIPIVSMVVEPVSTPGPIVEVTPTPTPRPTPKLAPTPTPEPASASAAANTPIPRPTPTITNTIAPIESPVPTEEALPSQVPAFPEEPGTLMVDNQPTTLAVGGLFSSGSSVLGSDIQRASITSVRFESSLAGAPGDAWDVSAEGNGSVLAWVTDGALTIAGKGGVRANADSSHLFAGYSAASIIDFNGCFYTDGVQNMAYMFSSCTELTSLNAEGFDTSNVSSMEGMFFMDIKLEEVNLSGFHTANVTTMRSMFESCATLKSLDLTDFNTTSAADMRWMFSGCGELAEISVASDFGEGKNTSDMFSGCPATLTFVDGGTEAEVDTQDWSNMEKYTSLKLWSKGDEVRQLQSKLSGMGYNPGLPDGTLGPNTISAIKAWQRDHGYEATGTLEAQQALELMG